MPPPIQSICSTIWKPGFELSKPAQTTSDTAKTNIVVSKATLRILRRDASLSSLIRRISNAPTSGRNVTVERIGQSVIRKSSRASSK